MVNSDVKSFWLLAVLAMCVLSLCHDLKMVTAEDCDVDLRGLEIECLYYMNKGDPSTFLNPNDRCCKVIKGANVPCVCRNLSKKLIYPPRYTFGDLLNWRKVLYCFSYCGRPFSAGYKCGNFTVPPK